MTRESPEENFCQNLKLFKMFENKEDEKSQELIKMLRYRYYVDESSYAIEAFKLEINQHIRVVLKKISDLNPILPGTKKLFYEEVKLLESLQKNQEN